MTRLFPLLFVFLWSTGFIGARFGLPRETTAPLSVALSDEGCRLATADRNQSGQAGHCRASSYCRELIDNWRLLHPATQLDVQLDPALEQRVLEADPTLQQALINLLNNASEASPERIAVTIAASDGAIELEILDDGPGVPRDIAEQLGKPIIIASAGGLGIGLLLTHATLTRFGGSVTLYNRPQGGTRTVATLPAAAI